ncbi:hypothetical protein BgiMline_015760, partial [Biomphalaria glabrata]
TKYFLKLNQLAPSTAINRLHQLQPTGSTNCNQQAPPTATNRLHQLQTALQLPMFIQLDQ